MLPGTARGACSQPLMHPRSIDDINRYIYKHDLHVLGLSESDLQSSNLRVKRRFPLHKGEADMSLAVHTLSRIKPPMLRRVKSNVKAGRSAGADTNDGYILKLSHLLIEDVLLHLVNLSISQSEFASHWNPMTVHPHHKKTPKIPLITSAL